MSDFERLDAWMKARDLNKYQMAREMGMKYIKLYHTLVVRPEKSASDKINGNFVVRFIATYGIDEAREIFAELMPQEVA